MFLGKRGEALGRVLRSIQVWTLGGPAVSIFQFLSLFGSLVGRVQMGSRNYYCRRSRAFPVIMNEYPLCRAFPPSTCIHDHECLVIAAF